MTRCESYPLCSGTIYFPTAPFFVAKIWQTTSTDQQIRKGGL